LVIVLAILTPIPVISESLHAFLTWRATATMEVMLAAMVTAVVTTVVRMRMAVIRMSAMYCGVA
jgi:hypothetical protein